LLEKHGKISLLMITIMIVIIITITIITKCATIHNQLRQLWHPFKFS